MNRLNPYLQDLQKEFRENYPEGPKLIVKCKEKSTEESFRATYSGGAVTLEAEGQQAAIFGIGLISAGVASGHLGECLGVRAPKFPLRPLWFSSMENVEEICRRVLALGYNAVLLEREGDVERLVLFREYGIKVILKPEPDLPEGKCFLDQEYRDAVREGLRALQQEVPRVDGFFWEGLFGQKDINLHPGARDLLQVDMALKEVRLLEEAILGDRFLIYYISCTDLQNAQQQAAWLPSFCNDVGKQTIIAFSAVSGDPVLDHLDSHPFWEVLRQSLDVCYTPLLPIINVGALNQGECLWPTLALDLINDYCLRCRRHQFAGVLSLVPYLPNPESFLSCNLWVASQVLWGRNHPELLAETWFAAFRPELRFPKFANAMKEIRQIAVELSRLRHLANNRRDGEISLEECRTTAESLLARLKQLQSHMEKTDSKQNSSLSLYDYFAFFARDARRIILNFLQAYHVSMGNLLTDDDRLESFWTESDDVQGTPLSFHERPRKGEVGTLMRRIYEEASQQGIEHKT